MFDVIGAMSLTTIAAVCVGALSLAAVRNGAGGSRFALLAAAWFVGTVSLAALGVFSRPTGVGTPAIGAAVVTPVLAGVIALARSRSVRALAVGVPVAVLVGANTGRILGGFLVALHSAGRLPPTFALTAGWGDIFVAATAVPLAWAIHRRAHMWRALTLAWNTLGILDLVTAVSLGVGSAPDSPVRFIFENPNSGTMGTLPWLMIPGFLVPLYALTHIVIYARLAASAAKVDRLPAPSAA